MKSLLIALAALVAAPTFAYTHSHSSPVTEWNQDTLAAWQVREAYVPITITHKGEATNYYIEVNDKPVSEVFVLEGNQKVPLDVPVTLEDRDGAQLFKVCSVSLTGAAGSRMCSEVELFNLYPSEG